MSGKTIRGRQAHRQKAKCDQQLSPSTENSISPRENQQTHYPIYHYNKEKLELCRKFIEYGYCPYDKKCKFAHGSHQLRRNHQANSRYKTKQCASFFNNGFCHYGNRCNFLHRNNYQSQHQLKWSTIKHNFREVIEQARGTSRFTQLFL